MNSFERKFFRSVEIAKALKSKRQTGKSFHVTVIFNKNKIISIGVNDYSRSHPKAHEYRKKEVFDNEAYTPSIHSELSAILKLGLEDCSSYTLFNVRIDNNGELNNSHPCSGCEGMMNQIGFKKFFYSDKKGSFSEYVPKESFFL